MNERLVVDASFAFRLLVPGPLSDLFRQQAGQWVRDGSELVAPTLWLYEITSALCRTVRMGSLTSVEGQQMLGLAHRLGVRLIAPDDALARAAFDWTLRLKRNAAYDSFYLALAEALQCELWTADRRLSNAVDLPWVRCVDGS